MLDTIGKEELNQTLENNPDKLKQVAGIKNKAVEKLHEGWQKFKEILRLS